MIKALEENPHMMDIWMKLIHDISGNRKTPQFSGTKRKTVLRRLPGKCPGHFTKHQHDRLLILMKKHLSNGYYTQMYLEVLLRLIAPPSCCAGSKPQYLNILKKALNVATRQRSIVEKQLFFGYAMCAGTSGTVRDFLTIITPRLL